MNRLGVDALGADAVRSRGVGPGSWDGGVRESLWPDRRPPVQHGLLIMVPDRFARYPIFGGTANGRKHQLSYGPLTHTS